METIYITSKDVKLSIDEILNRHDEPISHLHGYLIIFWQKISKDGLSFFLEEMVVIMR